MAWWIKHQGHQVDLKLELVNTKSWISEGRRIVQHCCKIWGIQDDNRGKEIKKKKNKRAELLVNWGRNCRRRGGLFFSIVLSASAHTNSLSLFHIIIIL